MAGASSPPQVVIAGAGPAGLFAAVRCLELAPSCRVLVLEKGPRPLAKLAASGGGRCNVTHACFDPRELASRYPRGARELLGPLSRFGPAETVRWFAARGVELKTEPDGRMFPVTDASATVVGCLLDEARRLGAELRTRCELVEASPAPEGGAGFDLRLSGGTPMRCDALLIATGGPRRPSDAALPAALGHSIVEPVPSLFTFKVTDPRLRGLAGITLPDVALDLPGTRLGARGPVLVTHDGLSGPAVLTLSSWAARELAARGHRSELDVRWLPHLTVEEAAARLREEVAAHPRRRVAGAPPDWAALPRRLWGRLATHVGLEAERTYADLDRDRRRLLARELTRGRFAVTGQSTNKDEFVTCGGIDLREVDFRTMGSRLVAGLHLAGEALDIDGPTGGYNLQAAWTTGYLAGEGLARVGR